MQRLFLGSVGFQIEWLWIVDTEILLDESLGDLLEVGHKIRELGSIFGVVDIHKETTRVPGSQNFMHVARSTTQVPTNKRIQQGHTVGVKGNPGVIVDDILSLNTEAKTRLFLPALAVIKAILGNGGIFGPGGR